MFAEQILSYPSTGLDAAPDRETTPAGRAERIRIGARDVPRVRPRASVDTLLAFVAMVWSIAFTHAELVPRSLAELLRFQLSLQDLALATLFLHLWPRMLALSGVYEARQSPARSEVFSVVVACTLGSLVAAGFLAVSTAEAVPGRTLGIFWGLSITTTLIFRGFAQAINTALLTREPRRVLIVGSGARAVRLVQELSAEPDTYELVGFVDDSHDAAPDEVNRRMLGDLNQLEDILMRQVVDEVVIALPIKSCYSEIQRAIRVCERVGVESKYLADAFHCSLARPRVEHGQSGAMVAMKVFYDDYRVTIKRAVDFVAALCGILVLSPLLIAIAVAIKLTSPGPVLFVQERYGFNKRRFPMYKFRTMVPNAEALLAEIEHMNEADGPAFKIKDDPRVTSVGRWLRRTSLDELPQLFNVLRGDMSLVGPRPMAVRDVQLFDQAWFMRRFSAPPGMTGLWQVSGRSNLGFDDWVTLDLKYIDEWSLSLDLKILARTIPVVMRGVGAM